MNRFLRQPDRAKALCASTAICGASTLMLLATPASAQTGGSTSLQEVVVTATKVETNVQRTPLAIDVYGGADLQRQGIRDLNNLAAVAPAVNISGSAGGTVVTMRGISSRDTTETGDPAVAISVDGFYQDRAYAIGLTQYDLDRIEVVKGPQGTLAGRNATAGAINIITVKPGKTFGGYAAVEAGSYNMLNTEGALNVPLGDRIQARASFSTTYHNGYRNSGTIAGHTDDLDAKSIRGQLSIQPIDGLELHALVQHTLQSGRGGWSQSYPYRVDASGAVIHQFDWPETDFFAQPTPSRVRLDDTMVRWDVTYKSPYATLSYLGGLDNLAFHGLVNSSASLRPSNLGGGVTPGTFEQNETPLTWNHEVRLTSPDPDARLTWQVGIYAFHESSHLRSINSQYLTGNVNIAFDYVPVFNSFSEFGQVAYKFTDQLKLTLGARHNNDRKQEDGSFGNAFFNAPLHGGFQKNQNTYHASLDYQATPTNLLYAKFDTGYKAGGFKDTSTYGPELVKSYEVGSKNRFMDNRLQLNVDAYFSNYTGQQVSQSVGLGSGTGGTIIVNAGTTHFYGVEADAVGLTDFGRFEVNLAYLHARFTAFPIAISQTRWTGTAWVDATIGNSDLKGNVPPNAPEWSIGASWQKDLAVWGGTLTPRVQTKYTSKQFFTFFNRQDEMQGGFTNTSLYLAYAPTGSNWELQGFVHNLEDKHVLANAGESAFTHAYGSSWLPPRTYGVRATARF